MGAEYFAGYVTEKALSVDNLFVFLIIMSSFRVPEPTSRRCCSSASRSPSSPARPSSSSARH